MEFSAVFPDQLPIAEYPDYARRACVLLQTQDPVLARDSAVLIMQGQACVYRTLRNSESKVDDAASLPSLVTSKLDLVPDREEKAMAAVRFLDPELFQRSLKGTPLTLLAANRVPRYVQNLVMGNDTPLRIATEYYELVHPWLPIISKRKVYERLLSPLVPIRVDVAFLLLCMSLLASSYKEIESPEGSLEYRAAIQYFTEIQRSGIVTPEILQGCILLAVYEWGHAIYPAAGISIGTSLQYALSLGMGWNKSTREALDSTWADEEEERRTWWAIYIIERVAAFGKPPQTLLVPEASMSAVLPGSDKDWDNHIEAQTVYTFSSPPESLGRYASVAQACCMLSCVFRHISDKSMTDSSRQSELPQLDRTLRALIRYSSETLTAQTEGAAYSVLCYQAAISFCTIMTLHSPYLQAHQPSELQQQARDASENAALVASKAVQEFLISDPTNLGCGGLPPFVMPWIYMAGLWFIRQGDSEHSKVIYDGLGEMNKKWKLAGRYLELLYTWEAMTYK